MGVVDGKRTMQSSLVCPCTVALPTKTVKTIPFNELDHLWRQMGQLLPVQCFDAFPHYAPDPKSAGAFRYHVTREAAVNVKSVKDIPGFLAKVRAMLADRKLRESY